MFENDEDSIDCNTCVGAGTTACSDCIVTHLLANDDGPIEIVPVRLVEVPPFPNAEETALDMFVRAGLVDAAAPFVSPEEFAAVARHPAGARATPV